RGGANRDVLVEPALTRARVGERLVEAGDVSTERAALARPGTPPALVTLFAESTELPVAAGDHLCPPAPPFWRSDNLLAVAGRLLCGTGAIERAYPSFPVAAGRFFRRRVAHAGDLRIARGLRLRGIPIASDSSRTFGFFLEELNPRGGVRLAGLLHARSNEA